MQVRVVDGTGQKRAMFVLWRTERGFCCGRTRRGQPRLRGSEKNPIHPTQRSYPSPRERTNADVVCSTHLHSQRLVKRSRPQRRARTTAIPRALQARAHEVGRPSAQPCSRSFQKARHPRPWAGWSSKHQCTGALSRPQRIRRTCLPVSAVKVGMAAQLPAMTPSPAAVRKTTANSAHLAAAGDAEPPQGR